MQHARRMLGTDYTKNTTASLYEKDFVVYDTKGKVVPIDQLPSARVFRGEVVKGEELLLVSNGGRFNIKVFSEKIPEMYTKPKTYSKLSSRPIFQRLVSLAVQDWV